MPFYGPLTLSQPLAAGDPRLQQFAQQLRQMIPGLTGLTTYPGPAGGGASAFGFTAERNPFQGAVPTTLEQALATLQPITNPAIGTMPESLTGMLAYGAPRREFGGGPPGGGQEGGPGAGPAVGPTGLGEVASQSPGLMGALAGALGFGVSSSVTGAEAAPIGPAGQVAMGLLGLAPNPLGLAATVAGGINTGIGIGRGTAQNLAASQALRPANPAFLAQRMGEIESQVPGPLGFPTAGLGLAGEVEQGLAPPTDIMNPNVIGAPAAPTTPGPTAMDVVAAQIGAGAAAGNVGVSDAATAAGVVGPASVEAAVNAGVDGGGGGGGGK